MRVLLAVVAAAAAALPASAEVTKEEVRRLAAAGLGDEVIIAYIGANRPVARMSVDDLIELKQAGVGDAVLKALVEAPAPSSGPPAVRSPIDAVRDWYPSPPVRETVVTPVSSVSPVMYVPWSAPGILPSWWRVRIHPYLGCRSGHFWGSRRHHHHRHHGWRWSWSPCR